MLDELNVLFNEKHPFEAVNGSEESLFNGLSNVLDGIQNSVGKYFEKPRISETGMFAFANSGTAHASQNRFKI